MNQPAPLLPRRSTRKVAVGPLAIGGDAPISVQSMTNVPTRDAQKCLEQITGLAQRGCELVRVAAATPEDTTALKTIVAQASVPIIADVHFHYRRALEAVEAGVAKIRLNPGNISDRQQVREVIAACRVNGVAIRIGVNEGSIVERRDEQKRQQEQCLPMAELMTAKLAEYVRIFEEASFENLVLSAKCHDAAGTIAVNRAISKLFDYPIHLGVTHAGDAMTGSIRSAAALGTLLAEGIGDTVRVSLTADPRVEVDVAWEILNTLGLRERIRPEIFACPTCGRTEVDIVAMTEQVKIALADVKAPITVAVMGCVVNGPGEAEHADIALCGGRDKCLIYRQGQKIATVPADKAIAALLVEIRKMIENSN
ncbi:MAG: flavodoxin-dependent (E)-4-hydroxy-3-methylbut-2-enyl-diphosphate synthase [Sedimentisphaerales bacterium]|nr:flavodoxin-dependent (E)-4-hydroxy-3-methylbut-2-enyl-diphosphate synthase [Sedimentisphaerales bacterium]